MTYHAIAPPRLHRARAAPLVFAIGVGLYALFQFTLALYPVLDRQVTLSPIDTYAYIAKAAQLRRCFMQDCPALQELHEQVAPDSDPERNWRRNIAYHRVLYTYHPLHSALIAALRTVGLDWLAAYSGVTILGGVLLGVAIAYFLYAVWGAAAAGLGLFLLASIVFPGIHGIHWIVPSNLALAIALITWATIVHRRTYARWAIPLGVATMLAMHPVGQVYAGLAIGLHLALADRRSHATWVVAGLGAAMVLVYMALPHLVSRPALGFWKHPSPADWSFWQALWDNLAAAWGLITGWAGRFGGFAPVLVFAGVGLITVAPQRRRHVYAMGGLLGALAVAGAFYVLPRYPAEVFSRLWIPAVIFATGCIGQAVWFWITAAASVFADLLRRRHQDRSGAAADDGGTRLAVPGLVIVGGLLFGGVATNGALGGTALASKFTELYRGYDQLLDVGQPRRVLATAGEEDRLVYMNELAMHLYLLHGGLDHGLVYYPAVAGSRLEPELLGATRNIRYAVAVHDNRLLRYGAGLWLGRDRPVEISVPPTTAWNEVEIKLENPGPAAALSLRVVADEQAAGDVSLAVPAGWSGWMRLPLAADLAALAIRLAPAAGGQWVKLAGLRLDGERRRNWPWDAGITLRLSDPASPTAEATTVRFESRQLLPPSCDSRGVIEDAGLTVAVAVTCRAPQ
jgi:hypothetical protein